MFSASVGVSSSASHTLSKTSVIIAFSSSVPAIERSPNPHPVPPFAAEERDRFHTPSYIGSDIVDTKLRFKFAILIAAVTIGGGRTTDR
jgi:hypothetical protein